MTYTINFVAGHASSWRKFTDISSAIAFYNETKELFADIPNFTIEMVEEDE